MRRLQFIFLLLLPGLVAAQSAPPTQWPNSEPKPATEAAAASRPGDPAAAKPRSVSPTAPPAAKPEPTPRAAPARAESPAASQPGGIPAAASQPGDPAPAKAESESTTGSSSSGSAPTRWPGAPEQPKAKDKARKRPAASVTPQPQRRARAAIRRPAARNPQPRARTIPINPAAPPKYAGTYRIDRWQSFEERGLYHFFYLQPGGTFLLGAEWPGRETSRAAGSWQASGDRLLLTGNIAVSTNKGRWRVPFRRAYRISLGSRGIRLDPLLEKNRFGLLGWPNSYFFFRTRLSPNLPSRDIPVDEEKLAALIKNLRNSRR